MTERDLSTVDALDALHQIRDELQVVWCALTNKAHAEECTDSIGEHVSQLHTRLDAICEAMQAKPAEAGQ